MRRDREFCSKLTGDLDAQSAAFWRDAAARSVTAVWWHRKRGRRIRSRSSVLLQRVWQVLLDGVGTWLVSGSCGRAEAAKERAFISGAAAALWRSAGDDLYGGISVAGCPRLHVPNENGAIVTLANAVQ